MSRILNVEGFSFRYVDAPRPAVVDFNLEVDEGEVVVLAGPSGCGKSTLLRAVNGLIPHMYAGQYSGEVNVADTKVRDTSMKDLAQKVGFLFQNPENQIFMFSVERDVAFGLENLGMERSEIRSRVDDAMGLLGITDLAHRAPHELSDGQKQRVALAGVIAMKPRLVILDEPTSLLDPMTASELVSLVDRLRREAGTAFVVVEHRLDLLVRIAGRLVVMSDGRKVLDGKPGEVLANADAEGYGVAVPVLSRLENSLRKDGHRLTSNLLGPVELANELNRRLA
ncbi:MAG: energy-coupling factor ABC transporter ATP-binding protein [Nitrososphaerales archaeon]|nr:energy-coupling factor ABC transporter ATP-binding protein [Nitrososphaerales archaeon]